MQLSISTYRIEKGKSSPSGLFFVVLLLFYDFIHFGIDTCSTFFFRFVGVVVEISSLAMVLVLIVYLHGLVVDLAFAFECFFDYNVNYV